MKPHLKHGVLFLHSMIICYQEKLLEIKDVLIDTGSASTVISVDSLVPVGIRPEPEDVIKTIRGVGGTETAFTRKLDYIQVDDQRLTNFEIEITGMDYGFDMQGILGMDFLIPSGAVLDLRSLNVDFR